MPEIAGLPLAAVIHFAIALPVCAHILLTKEQEGPAIAWIGVVLLSPFVGGLLYWLFGINRIARRARRMQRRPNPARRYPQTVELAAPVAPEEQIVHLGRALHEMPLLLGNRVTPLIDGDGAYPAMLTAIDQAKRSIALSSYIFDYDGAGRQFIDALIAARRRGVTVRVLLDQFGELYSRRSVGRELRGGGVTTAHFMSGRLRNLPFLNLRNHRKIMIVDGSAEFIGGMNIRHGNVLSEHPSSPVHDIHFQVQGPVIDQLNVVFENDWDFAAGEEIRLPSWTKVDAGNPSASTAARILAIGPDHEINKLQWLLLGALSVCRSRVVIMTPYFLPNEALAAALMVAAMRGLDVEILLPRRSNIFGLDWAMAAKWEPLVMHGVKIYLTPPPFDHSKVMVVDGAWVLVGSTNWDQRSLRLNFEADLEAHDPVLGAELEAYAARRRAGAHLISRRDVAKTPLALRLRNNFVRLFAPYL